MEETLAPLALFASAASLAGCVLASIGLVCRRRTMALRAGEVASSRHRMDGPVRTSPVTFVPAAAGAVCFVIPAAPSVASLLVGGRAPPPGLLATSASGLVVVALGLATRVTSIHADVAGVAILYRWRRPFVARWAEVIGLTPPRSVLDGWTVVAATPRGLRRRRLMASDLLGHENVLDLIAERAGLRFDGSGWIADGPI